MRAHGVLSPHRRPADDHRADGSGKEDATGLGKHWVGVIMVIASVLLWVGSSFLTKVSRFNVLMHNSSLLDYYEELQ